MTTLTRSVFVIAMTIMLPMAAIAQGDTTPPSHEEVSHVGIMPSRGMTMEQVKQSFGEPAKVIAAVGKPPISRWFYDGFVVYFEGNHVIHALATADAPQ